MVSWYQSKKYLSNLDRLETVQRYFTRRLYFRCNVYVKRSSPNYISYTQRLTLYNLESIELRRFKFDLVMIFKLSNNHIADNSEQILNFSNSSLKRHNSYKLAYPSSNNRRNNCKI